MDYIVILKLVGGLVGLCLGGEFLIRGSSKIASFMGISSLVIGLTVVAFGTSAPELVVSLQSSFSGHADIAVANVVGSNIFNILFILGSCALFAPLIVNSQLVRLDVPLMAFSSILLLVFSLNNNISFFEGLAFVSILAVYTVVLVKKSRKESRLVKEEFESEYPADKMTPKSLTINLLFLAAGLVLLIVGGDWLVSSSVSIARQLGVSDAVIGLTIIAAGTSLPEVATSIIATIKGERDIAIGNVVGSGLFNIFMILGLTSVFTKGGVNVSQELFAFDMPVMIASSIACLPIFLAGFTITRLDGIIFLSCYVLYITFLVLSETNHVFLEMYQNGITYIVIPLLVLSLLASSIQAINTLRSKT